MSSDVPPPPSRESLYPEPHRAPGWQDQPPPAAPRRRVKPVVWIVAGAFVVVALVTASWGYSVGVNDGTAPVTVTDPGGDTINAIQADVGTCLKNVGKDGAVARTVALPCSSKHRAEVVAKFQFDKGDFPGTDAVRSQMLTYCGREIQPGFTDAAIFQQGDWEAGVRWVAWAPTAASWDVNDRTGVCVAYRDGDMVGSFVAGTVSFVNK